MPGGRWRQNETFWMRLKRSFGKERNSLRRECFFSPLDGVLTPGTGHCIRCITEVEYIVITFGRKTSYIHPSKKFEQSATAPIDTGRTSAKRESHCAAVAIVQHPAPHTYPHAHSSSTIARLGRLVLIYWAPAIRIRFSVLRSAWQAENPKFRGIEDENVYMVFRVVSSV